MKENLIKIINATADAGLIVFGVALGNEAYGYLT